MTVAQHQHRHTMMLSRLDRQYCGLAGGYHTKPTAVKAAAVDCQQCPCPPDDRHICIRSEQASSAGPDVSREHLNSVRVVPLEHRLHKVICHDVLLL
jgi:hypothetical protein